MDDDLLEDLRHIIDERYLTTVFQPLLDIRRGTLYGYEALIRGPGDSPLHSPAMLFECARNHGLILSLDHACWETTSADFRRHGAQGKLFVNVSPASLDDPAFHRSIANILRSQADLSAGRVVVEITEQYPLEDYARVSKSIRMLRELGVEIAIDDLGAGYSGLRAWSELRPHYVKIDRHFIEYIDTDPVKREFVNFIRRIAHELNCRVVAEGIETAGELAAVQALNVDFGQGFFLGRPAQQPESADRIEQRVVLPIRSSARGMKPQSVGAMALVMPTLTPQTRLEQAADQFHSDRSLSSLPVVENDVVLGVVKRHETLEMMAGRYFRELHGKKPVTQFMDVHPVYVEHDDGLEVASQLLTNDVRSDLTQDFVILEGGRYLGIGKTSTLLRRITEQQLHYARYANPLTMLPGNPPIHEQLNDALRQAEAVHVAYIDLNHFKPYNDHYGYDAGDRILVQLARILQSVTDPSQDFLGHVGGDDFIVVFRSRDWRDRCEQVLSTFAEVVPSFYDATALARGGIRGRNRRGEPEFFDLISVAIGVVAPDPVHCVSSHDVARLASEAKLQAKATPDGGLFVSRRRRPNCVA